MSFPAPKPTALEQAFKLLTPRAHSTRELERKLRARGYSAPEIRTAITECRRYGLLNDRLFAADCAGQFALRGCGVRLIARKLREKGVSAEDAEEALAEVKESEAERAQSALEFKLRLLNREEDPRKKREKCFRFLLSRGFSTATIARLPFFSGCSVPYTGQ